MPLELARSDVKKATLQTRPIEIGLLNNFSDAGLEGGDRQIVDLLRDAAGSEPVRLSFFSLPSIPRGPAGRAHIAAHYTEFSRLFESRLDGLFVTGCEPRTNRLPDEAFWPQLIEVIDWAEHNTRSSVWSCLAAHAAVLHLDGIQRRPLNEKCTGVFDIAHAGSHPLLAGAPDQLRVPHSRHNGLDASELEAAGYQVLTRGPQISVDSFVKPWRSLFVYLQGHPEYDPNALRREYRRDITRFLDGTIDAYPTMPVDYFSPAMQSRLERFARLAQRDRAKDLVARIPIGRHDGAKTGAWNNVFAKMLFRNWLAYLRAKTSSHAV